MSDNYTNKRNIIKKLREEFYNYLDKVIEKKKGKIKWVLGNKDTLFRMVFNIDIDDINVPISIDKVWTEDEFLNQITEYLKANGLYKKYTISLNDTITIYKNEDAYNTSEMRAKLYVGISIIAIVINVALIITLLICNLTHIMNDNTANIFALVGMIGYVVARTELQRFTYKVH